MVPMIPALLPDEFRVPFYNVIVIETGLIESLWIHFLVSKTTK